MVPASYQGGTLNIWNWNFTLTEIGGTRFRVFRAAVDPPIFKADHMSGYFVYLLLTKPLYTWKTVLQDHFHLNQSHLWTLHHLDIGGWSACRDPIIVKVDGPTPSGFKGAMINQSMATCAIHRLFSWETVQCHLRQLCDHLSVSFHSESARGNAVLPKQVPCRVQWARVQLLRFGVWLNKNCTKLSFWGWRSSCILAG